MYTQCSRCSTLFRVSARHLRQAQGLVRCGLCDEIFEATTSLLENLPASLAAYLTGSESVAEQKLSLSTPADIEEDYFTPLSEADAPEPGALVLPRKPASLGLGVLGLCLAIVILLGGVFLSYGYIMRAELAQYPRLRPWIEVLCSMARCQLPLLQDVAQIEVLHKDAELDVSEPDQLLVQAIIANGASFRQAYPHIRIRVFDALGSSQATPWFGPDDYLQGGSVQNIQEGMPPQEPVQIRVKASGVQHPIAQDNFILDVR